ncbi:cytosine permease [Alteromonas aestuariivivens]|uniref:Cytosine permease n=1 Tax=Alteromonas aestuariivivens TaxID=1938339 RepID=A0A3D8MBM5_9ALTE|nr:cytosine permease [Alteromonas aestuariivivens]RDV26812.1 cytosine permease [Alteromonas aestuariivivens]
MESSHHNSSTPVEPSQLVSWPRVAAVSAMVSFSIPTFVTGIELYNDMSLYEGLMAVIVGAILLTVVGGLVGTIGAATRLNSYQLAQTVFGHRGASVLNLAFALSLIGWFGVNLDLFSASVNKVALATLGQEFAPVLIEAIAGTGMTITTLYGFSAINRLAAYLVPVMIAITAWIAFASSQQLSISEWLSVSKSAHLSFSDGVSVIVGVIIIGAIIMPDITRFSRQLSGGVHTAFWSYGVVQTLVLLIAAFSAAAFATDDILEVLLALGIGSAVLAVVIAGSWILNALNIYSAQLAISESFSLRSERTVTLVLGVLGMVAAFVNVLDYFITFLSVLTAIFIPVGGIIACDYYLINKSKYSHTEIKKQIHWPALVAWLAGAGLAVATQFFALPSVTQVAALDAMLLTAAVYFLLCRASARHQAAALQVKP